MALDDIIDWLVQAAIRTVRAVARGIEWLAARLRQFFTNVANWLEGVEATVGWIASGSLITITQEYPGQATIDLATRSGSTMKFIPVARGSLQLTPSEQEIFDATDLSGQQYMLAR